MELTGKCKDAFYKWSLKNAQFIYDYAIENDDKTGIPSYEGTYFHFQDIDDYPESMKYGVYVDFFLANDIIVDIQPVLDYNEDTYTKVLFYILNVTKLNFTPTFDNSVEIETLSESRKQAIKKANEIFNNG